MKPSDALAIHRTALRQLVARHGLLNPRVFGSTPAKTDTEESDLDLLVDSVPGSTTLFTLGGLQAEARELLGVKVEVLTPGFLPPKILDKVLQEAEPL
jgi:predicted nucleotidyltransferase